MWRASHLRPTAHQRPRSFRFVFPFNGERRLVVKVQKPHPVDAVASATTAADANTSRVEDVDQIIPLPTRMVLGEIAVREPTRDRDDVPVVQQGVDLFGTEVLPVLGEVDGFVALDVDP